MAGRHFSQHTEDIAKQFYTTFKKHRTAFLGCIEGIDDHLPDKQNTQKHWYAALMLNRLMFCYFLQKKGFLDQDPNYLQTKLQAYNTPEGRSLSYTFYRGFLRAFFHEGLGKPVSQRCDQVDFGHIPYLNSSLFAVHELEQQFPKIKIVNEAFERIFNFFDGWNWHTDDCTETTGKNIHPDAISYIFEKHINDRATTGAYYTKDDITEYISTYSILPFLLNELRRRYARAFTRDGEIWRTLRQSGDTYIYESLKKGLNLELPEHIAIGLFQNGSHPGLLERRKGWNTLTPEEYGLPTEIWRETIERRQRYDEVKQQIENGDITEINDFITYNLNIRQFLHDIIAHTRDTHLLWQLYQTISNVTVLDPACGSGEFLFAALNVLEPLYTGCLQRMDQLTAEQPEKHAFFEEALREAHSGQHPNLQYFVYKSIILNNLYGVDLMPEAVELVKLRLSLKLITAFIADPCQPNSGVEPLPDLDLNFRIGNTLVGFATEQEFLDATKHKLIRDLKTFTNELSRNLACYYGISEENIPNPTTREQAYQYWLDTHQPFHWFAEFYKILVQKGGFDVIIGNPPYVEYSKVKNSYQLAGYVTQGCGNIYANVIERCHDLVKEHSKIGMIVQLPLVCTDRMMPLQRLLQKESSASWFATFDDRPGKLFDGLEHIRATILMLEKGQRQRHTVYSTPYQRWYSEYRPYIFENQRFVLHDSDDFSGTIPKLGREIAKHILKKLKEHPPLKRALRKQSAFVVYVHNAPQYFIRATNFVPHFWNERDGQKMSRQIKALYFDSLYEATLGVALLNSTLFYWWFILLSDCRHLNMREIHTFPISFDGDKLSQLPALVYALMEDFQKNARRKACHYKTTGHVRYDEYFPRKSKSIIDEIDSVLAEHYGFIEEELDFILNYDIKYRLGEAL